jgi:transaldolase
VGPETVNTIPTSTLDAYRDHGRPSDALAEGVTTCVDRLERLHAIGIDLEAVTTKLQLDGVAAFAASFDQLMAALDGARAGRADG